jgi:hypothetical protein
MRMVPRLREQKSAAAHQGVDPKLLTQIAIYDITSDTTSILTSVTASITAFR